MSGSTRPGCLATRHPGQPERCAQRGLQIMSDLPPSPPTTSTLPWRVFSSLIFFLMPIKSLSKYDPVRDLVLNLIIRVDINNFCQTSKFAKWISFCEILYQNVWTVLWDKNHFLDLNYAHIYFQRFQKEQQKCLLPSSSCLNLSQAADHKLFSISKWQNPQWWIVPILVKSMKSFCNKVVIKHTHMYM